MDPPAATAQLALVEENEGQPEGATGGAGHLTGLHVLVVRTRLRRRCRRPGQRGTQPPRAAPDPRAPDGVTLRDRQLRERVPPRPPSKRLTTSIDRVGHGHSLVHSAFCSPDGATRAWQRRRRRPTAHQDRLSGRGLNRAPTDYSPLDQWEADRQVPVISGYIRTVDFTQRPIVETDTSSCRPACQHFPGDTRPDRLRHWCPNLVPAATFDPPGGTTAWPVGSRQSASPARMFRDRHPDGKPQPLIHTIDLTDEMQRLRLRSCEVSGLGPAGRERSSHRPE